jgi:hypothetical protein
MIRKRKKEKKKAYKKPTKSLVVLEEILAVESCL